MSKTPLNAHPNFIISRPLAGSLKHTDSTAFEQIANLIARILSNRLHELAAATRSQIYATVRDNFLDFHGYQSGNDNPSQNHGVHA
jgi:hypothetical protein